ncbi:MAG: BrnT family toxin [Clostridia bacterium]|nr:BrnT family toxin [Clostridia bacterium]
METISFEWDDAKNEINIQKHHISFEEAKTVFYDDDAVLFDDPDHSIGEERFLILGITQTEKLCIVSHCYRDNDNVIRLISARKATKNETRFYQNGARG